MNFHSWVPTSLLACTFYFCYLAVRAFARRDPRFAFYIVVVNVACAVSGVCFLVQDLAAGYYGAAAGDLFWLIVNVVAAWYYWRRWKDRRRALKAIGAKSRALLDALAERMRETARPGPARIPA